MNVILKSKQRSPVYMSGEYLKSALSKAEGIFHSSEK